MVREYMFNDPENMIQLAMDIQSNVYWGGHFLLDHEDVSWKDFWNIVIAAREVKKAIGVEIASDNEVRFIYKREVK